MAYKFQLGLARLSGSVVQEGSVTASGSDVVVGALLKMPDNTAGKIMVADGTSYQEVAMSGDVAIAVIRQPVMA